MSQISFMFFFQNQESQTVNNESKMKSGHFLVLHTIISTALLGSCAIYISVTRDLSVESDNALILPQLLAVIPGCFFTLARSILLIETPQICHEKVWKVTKTILAVILGLIAYGSLIPALMWSAAWKIYSAIED